MTGNFLMKLLRCEYYILRNVFKPSTILGKMKLFHLYGFAFPLILTVDTDQVSLRENRFNLQLSGLMLKLILVSRQHFCLTSTAKALSLFAHLAKVNNRETQNFVWYFYC